MNMTESQKKYGDYLKSVREGLGLDRDQFAARIGVSSTTVRNVENGHQGLGRAAKRAVEILADPNARFGAPRELAEAPARYIATHTEPAAKAIAKIVARLASDEALQRKVAAVQEAFGCTYEHAVEVVAREIVEQPE